MFSLIELFRNKQRQHQRDEDVQLELQIQRDIEDVFGEIFEEDEELEETAPAPERASTPPPLRSEQTISKRKLQEAVDSILGEGESTSTVESTRKRSRFEPEPIPSPPPKPTTFLPFSPASLTARLNTFTLPAFTSSAFSARDAAEKGWENKGRERLVCGECKSAWVVSDLKGLKPATAEKLKLRMRRELVEAHKETCPWRVTSERKANPTSNSSQSLLPTTSHLLSLAATLAPRIPLELRISHPELPRATLAILSSSPNPSPTTLPSLLLTIFNWTLFIQSSSSSQPNSSSPDSGSSTVVQCSTCLRRVGLWTYSSPPTTSAETKTFDLRREHLVSCAFRGVEVGGVETEAEGGRWKAVLDALVKGLDEGRDREEEVVRKRKELMKNPRSFMEELLGPKPSQEELRKEREERKRLMEGTGI